MATNTERARKLLVRTALVTSSTIATMFGAQNLALLDGVQFQQLSTTAEPVSTTLVQPNQDAPDVFIDQASPNFVILRHANPNAMGNNTQQSAPLTQTNNSATFSFQPPVPNQAAAPAPIIVQQNAQTIYVPAPVRQKSQSSR